MSTELLPKLEGLGTILREHIDAHKHLTFCALKLKDALVACDHKAIERLSLENERAAAKVRNLENKRIAFLRDASLVTDDPPSFTQLEELLSQTELTDDEATALEELANLRVELVKIIHELDHHNQLNLTLIGQALEFQEFSMQLLMNNLTGKSTGYTSEGHSLQDERSGLIDGLV
jgi:hypothetical protein